MKNGKTSWVFLFQKYGKFWSISPWISLVYNFIWRKDSDKILFEKSSKLVKNKEFEIVSILVQPFGFNIAHSVGASGQGREIQNNATYIWVEFAGNSLLFLCWVINSFFCKIVIWLAIMALFTPAWFETFFC